MEKPPFIMSVSSTKKVVHLNYFTAQVDQVMWSHLEVIGGRPPPPPLPPADSPPHTIEDDNPHGLLQSSQPGLPLQLSLTADAAASSR